MGTTTADCSTTTAEITCGCLRICTGNIKLARTKLNYTTLILNHYLLLLEASFSSGLKFNPVLLIKWKHFNRNGVIKQQRFNYLETQLSELPLSESYGLSLENLSIA